MDTTTLKAQIRFGVTQPKHNGSGMTKLLVAIPLDCRTMLAEMATSTGTSQQELIRSAIRSFLINEGHYEPGHFVQRLPKVKELKAREKVAKDQAVHQVAPGVSIVKTEPEPKTKTQLKADNRPPQPSPTHTWVVRGSGGYWRARKGTSK